ncbi:MAG: DUF1592 domain-containing protein [Verrucomicrobiales bacterium]|nr:DUF1592 domain-containing protein [Verrucomicrobiales bacterium]
MFDRELPPEEIERHFRAGVKAKIPPPSITKTEPKNPEPKPNPDPVPAGDGGPRTGTNGLVAFYDFEKLDGPIIRDVSGFGEPLNLKIENPGAVRHSSGSLEITGKTLIRSEKPASKISEAVKKSNEITIEAWIRPANTKQDGPARAVTISRDTGERNFTLGQEFDSWDVRFRTQRSDRNGSPSTNSGKGSLAPKLTHVVFTRDSSGRAQLFLDGRKRGERKTEGNLSPWNGGFHLALGNEMTKDRTFLGTYHLVAIYNRDLSPADIQRNFRAGPNAKPGEADLLTKADENARLFEEIIAPLLAEHCLECHDSSTREGKLDLSTKLAVFAFEKKGKKAIVAGKPDLSKLWTEVESDEMPEDRDPLSAEEKKLLKQWIEGGANWTLAQIDPADYIHMADTSGVWIQRLTVPEYIATVKAATGVDISREARELLPAELRADGFSNTAYNLGVDLKHIDAYTQLAGIIVGKMDTRKFVEQFSKNRSIADDKKTVAMIEDMGKWLLRGPLENDEVHAYRGIMTTVAALDGEYDEAVKYVIEAMLQSPRFIYRVENQRGDGTAQPANEYEIASRMSYILWGAPPDRELLQAAERGDLYDRERSAKQVDRMLKDPRAVDRSVQFLEEWLHLTRMQNIAPNAKRFPEWNDQLAADMRAETVAFFKSVAWDQKRPLADLLNARETFVSPKLAEFYGFNPQPETEAGAQLKYDLNGVKGRGGILTQGSILTVGGDDASMVTRGLFVMHDLLRGVVKDPPPCVDTTPVKSKPGLTQRMAAESRIKSSDCGGCHAKFEPFAFGLEKFNGIGAFRDKDEFGNAMRDDGQILIPGEAEPKPYQNSEQLMDLLAGSDRVKQTITWKLTQFALGRPPGARDRPILNKIHEEAQKDGGSYQAVVKAIVLSDLIRTTPTENP